jgi:methylmalonyl-CoA/ethylmalonyl-CoA epimerase
MSSTAQIDPTPSGKGNGKKFHHVGFVVSSIEEAIQSFSPLFSAPWDGNIFYDPLQAVRVTFLQTASSKYPLIELVEPAGENSPVLKFLKKGGGLHHLCYEVESLDSQLRLSELAGDLVVGPPQAAVAFAGRRIVWVYTKGRLLLEYLER